MENKERIGEEQNSPAFNELQAAIKIAKEEMEMWGAYHSQASIKALTDMVIKAEEAANGGKSGCFNRNREFLKMDKEAICRFALRRFTMAPTYLWDGKAYGEYGLQPAIAWFQEQNLLLCGKEKLHERVNILLTNAREACEEYPIGSKVGCYGTWEKEVLMESIKKLEKATTLEEMAKAAVKAFDAYDAFRKSRILRSDQYPKDTLFYTEKELEQLKEEIQRDSVKKRVYQTIKKLADSHTLKELESNYTDYWNNASYEELNRKYYLWSSTGKTVNFFSPKECVYATLSLELPSDENEEDGLGHIWIDNISIFSASGEDVEIKNSGFEQGEEFPDHWINQSKKKECMKLEKRPVYCGTGKSSLFLQNLTAFDEARADYGEKIPLKGACGYTLVFDAKLDGKCKNGLKATINFYSAEEKKLGEFIYYFNKKSYLSPREYPLTAQCDAICYGMTKDKIYAQKAKLQILYTLNDFCQGAEYWLVMNERPDQSDAYGAVQGGRILCSLASAYSLIKEAGCFDKTEKEIFYGFVDYMLRYMLDLRNRTELSGEQAQKNCSNWQTDMCAGTAMMMLVLDDYPDRTVWLDNAVHILRAQLEFNINPDGSWPESVRYHFAALERFMAIAKAVKFNLGEDWFQDTKLIEMFRYSLQVQTPSYCYFDGHPATPPFGDHILGNGKEFSLYGVYLNDIENYDRKLAGQMYDTWEKAGKPLKDFKTESIALENLFCSDYKAAPGSTLVLDSNQNFKYSGLYLFRDKVGTKEESYLAVMSSPKKIGHGHLDQGSFILYYHCIPLIMDSGVEGYFDSSTQWHISSYSHACMQFQTKKKAVESQNSPRINLDAGNYSLERGWADVPVKSKVLACHMGGNKESIVIQIENPEGKGSHIRKITIDHTEDIYLIEDKVDDFDGEILFNLPVVAQECRIGENNKVYAKGYYHVNIEIEYKSKVNRLWLEEGRTIPFFPTDKSVGMLKYIRAAASAKDGFCVEIRPISKENSK